MAGYAVKLHISFRGRADVMKNRDRPKIITDRIIKEIDDMSNL